MSDNNDEFDGRFELGDISLGAILKVSKRIDGLHHSILQQHEEILDIAIQGNAYVNSSGIAVIDLGGPQQGREWSLRRLVVGGYQWGSSIAGTCQIISTAYQPSDHLEPNTQNILDVAQTLPSISFYGEHQIVIHNPNRLYAYISGGTQNQVASITGSVMDYPDRRYKMRSIV